MPGYVEISDLRVSAYAPMSSRLMRDLRDGSKAVARHTFHGPFLAQIALTKNFGDPNTSTDPPAVYFPIDTFQVDVPGGIAGTTDVLLSCWVELAISGSPSSVPKVYYRLTDGTTATVSITKTVGDAATQHRFDWIGAVAAEGMKTWTWEAGFYVPSPGSASGVVRHRATEHGSYLEEWRP